MSVPGKIGLGTLLTWVGFGLAQGPSVGQLFLFVAFVLVIAVGILAIRDNRRGLEDRDSDNKDRARGSFK